MVRNLYESLESSDSTQAICTIGFCWGALPALEILTLESSKVKGGMLAHPSRMSQFEKGALIRYPIHLLLAETDDYFTPECKDEFVSKVAKGLVSESVYPGTAHGFTVRPENTAHGMEMQRKVLDRIVNFLTAVF
eukprot:Protomagalhaensia_wolfi_Nauph_80__3110@NODE_317_length_2800_cov_20_693227_g239_i0_p2_GENE_NODE_317_length_2800_cov_20_693227_g239_i0NODE_317_length_2800_cov_20_693227_g239_i0_p2_ORF_typecomplete_len135_score11_28DLH/PF01738_18/5_1e17Hydrolase_4/PF12146_8/0_0019Abhydrolase_1/PF00561_20/0_38_NODE_317_length_2800_cov_20_693227_g239_i019372341